jgi:hypothetical protein
MKPDPLLEAIFRPGEDTLRPVLKAARRRRVRRVILRASCVAACVVAATWLLILQTPSRSTRTANLAPGSSASHASGVSIVATAARAPRDVISTRPLAGDEVVHTRSNSIVSISTANTASTPALIADTELLATFEPGRVALIGSGAEARLVKY